MCNISDQSIGKKMRWSLTPRYTALKGFLIMFTRTFGDIPKLLHLEAITALFHLLMIILGIVGYTPCDIRTRS